MKPEQVDLLRKAGESLGAAKLMEKQGYHDFAASRAYYTMFYVAEALLLEKVWLSPSILPSTPPSANTSLTPAFCRPNCTVI